MSKLQIDRHDIFCFQKRYKFGNGVIRLKHDFTSFFCTFSSQALLDQHVLLDIYIFMFFTNHSNI